MPFKWINCHYCNHNKHIDCFPYALRKRASQRGTAICSECCDKHDEIYVSPLERHGLQFFHFLKAIGAKA